ncbi:MAG: tetratricopeptide repeat protein [Candidatus Omnitrophica bacterium]|nr:tetratricopeptide repeat protein [Candidatus Omnitrophota bacterium]
MRQGKLICMWVLFTVFMTCLSFGEEAVKPERLFYAGNDYYEKGDYAKAIAEYEKIIASGYESAYVYYNLGNAYFRAGRPGKAMLNYERAKRLMPGNADIDANYKFVRAKTRGPVLTRRGVWEWRPLRRYYESFTVDGLLWISSALYVLAAVIFAVTIYRRYAARRFIIAALLVLLCAVCNLFVVWHKAGGIGREAVIIAPRAEARYGPFDPATVFFKLHEGMKVTVLGEKGDWYKVRRADGKKGWIHGEDAELI